MPETFPLVHAAGTHRELGRQHGEQAREKIDRFLDYQAQVLNISRDSLRRRARKFLPLFEKTCPHLLDEIEGLAEGARLPLNDALASQLRGELGQVADGGCTSLVIGGDGTADGNILIGQTSDNPPELIKFGYVLHLKPEDRPEVLMWTFGGMIGYHGLNRAGVAHFANSLTGGPRWKNALSHYPLKRMILERQTVGDIVQLMRDVSVCSNGNYALSDGQGNILDVELTTEGPEILEEGGQGFLAHANHYRCAKYATPDNHQQSLPDSFTRQERIEKLIGERFGSIRVDDIKKMFSDHENHPTSICRHPYNGPSHAMLDNNARTVTAIIAEPAHGRLHVSCGNPCENSFVEYRMDEA